MKIFSHIESCLPIDMVINDHIALKTNNYYGQQAGGMYIAYELFMLSSCPYILWDASDRLDGARRGMEGKPVFAREVKGNGTHICLPHGFRDQ